MAIREKLVTQLHAEARAMASHALGTGLAVPPATLEVLTRLEEHPGQVALRELASVHAELARLVAPCTPELLALLYKETDDARLKQTFGQVRVTRSFMLAALISIATFIGISLSNYIKDPRHGDFFTSSGWPLFVNEMFFVSSAAIGASFSTLFQVNREITSGTYRPRDEPSYWVQFTLGIVAGLLLSTVLNLRSIEPQGDVALTRMNFSSALLALLGGFSSSVVQKVIQRIIDALETVVRGSQEQEIKVREQESRLRAEETLARERMRTTLLLHDLRRRLAAGEGPEALRALLSEAGRSILSSDGRAPEPAVIPAAPEPAAEGAAPGPEREPGAAAPAP